MLLHIGLHDLTMILRLYYDSLIFRSGYWFSSVFQASEALIISNNGKVWQRWSETSRNSICSYRFSSLGYSRGNIVQTREIVPQASTKKFVYSNCLFVHLNLKVNFKNEW